MRHRGAIVLLVAAAYMITQSNFVQRLELLRDDALLNGALHFDVLYGDQCQRGGEKTLQGEGKGKGDMQGMIGKKAMISNISCVVRKQNLEDAAARPMPELTHDHDVVFR